MEEIHMLSESEVVFQIAMIYPVALTCLHNF